MCSCLFRLWNKQRVAVGGKTEGNSDDDDAMSDIDEAEMDSAALGSPLTHRMLRSTNEVLTSLRTILAIEAQPRTRV